MKTSFKLNAITSVVLASWFSQPILAQEQQTQSSAEEQVERTEVEQSNVEVIEVKGFRGSLQKSINSKRFRDGVSDSIHAEDVGKSTDQNIADALSRVTGVVVQEEAGEGTRITVRGAGPALNQVSINGIALTGGLSGGANDSVQDNSVDLSSFSADILSSIDVVKTPSADQDEGSLGANIELNTVRPLSLNAPRRTATVEGRHNQFANDEDYRIVGSFADKYLDDKLGFIVTVTKDRQNTRVDNIQTGFLQQPTEITDPFASNAVGRPATDFATGRIIRPLGNQRDANGALILDDNGQPISNPIESLLNFDPDTQIAVEGDLFVFRRQNTSFNLNTDIRDRFSVSSGLQYALSDDTMVQLDITHSQQEVFTDNNNVFLNFASALNGADDNPSLTQVDLSTNTILSSVSRNFNGSLRRTSGNRELETNVITLNLQHSFNDRLSASLRLGYSRTEDETPEGTDPEAFTTLSTGNFNVIPLTVVDALPNQGLEPVGFDCSQGPSLGECSFFTGTTPLVIDALDGQAIGITSRFNPLDLNANHIQTLTFRNNRSTDTNRSAFLDFDYELDGDYITSIEFGGKYVDRNRNVAITNQVLSDPSGLVDADDPDTAVSGSNFGEILVSDIVRTEAFPFDDFAAGLQSENNAPFFGGFPLLDTGRAIELITGLDPTEVAVRSNPQGTREINTETVAAYFKANFEFLDGKLTGNLGVRYVRDRNEATGVGGITFIGGPNQIDPFDLFVTRDLANPDNPPCPTPIAVEVPFGNGTRPDFRSGTANADELTNCFAFQLTHAVDFLNPDTIPFNNETGEFQIPGANGETGIDVNRVVFIADDGSLIFNPFPQQVFDTNGELVNVPNLNRFTRAGRFGTLAPFVDLSVSTFGPLVTDRAANLVNVQSSDSNTTDNWLPSITFNYAYNDETIFRLGLSRTLTRPNFDLLNPAATIREGNFNDQVTQGSAGNTQLEPLTSNNIDFSYEWYFNNSGLFSVALFYKDFQNFTASTIEPFQFRDVRTNSDLGGENLLLEFDENRLPGGPETCQPNRLRENNGIAQFFIECDTVFIDTASNGASGDIKGVELAHTQNYDFLPGLLSGFGTSINYTFQESSTGEEEIGETGQFIDSLPFVNTPEHSANFTLFWEKDGIQFRVAHRWTDTQLISRTNAGNAIWQDPVGRLDLSASYRINKTITLTFNALNLNNDVRRRFVTASGNLSPNNPSEVVFNEGNIFDNGDVTTDRTQSLFRFGRQFRIGIRGNF